MTVKSSRIGSALVVGTTLLAVLVVLPGCGGSAKSAVTGEVTLNGKKMVMGQIHFVDKDKKKFSTMITGDGTYRLPDIPPGDYKVYLESPMSNMMQMGMNAKMMMAAKMKGKGPMRDPSGQYKSDGTAPPDPSAAKLVIPMKYRTPENSGLSCTVKAGETTTYPIQMASK